MKQLDISKIIEEAKKRGYDFALDDAQDVINTKPTWFNEEETEAQAVADYIDAFGG